ncbi:flavin reductase family protein [Cesiribacter andamanensis]|uniref:Flavin reductase like domain protein n=1 Tax=Cesiribacter andamanensis AMV16 TaxID=1279009 RepID=M7N8D7_9BACT|nr:flavin reductase family protein [Cesiribacter andamanensis]EMR03527.1 Flavin reductase like domain protein [Cesiribacter andamanensis AMV16]
MNPKQKFISIDPKQVSIGEFHGMMLGAVAPRPIAFASTVDKEGNVNLSPFSFFNCFGANPPILVFSPSRRVRDNTTKHTLENVQEVPEVVINIVNYPIVQQMSLASTEYPKGVDEFAKSGLTPLASQRVAPPRVAEAPASFECRVTQIIPLGEEGGAGNLVVCEVLMMHVQEGILNEKGKIDPQKLDAVARMGGDYYCRASGTSIFEVAKPLRHQGIGVDQIPESIRTSKVLTGNDLGKLGNVEELPDPVSIRSFAQLEGLADSLDSLPESERQYHQHLLALKYLQRDEVESAWRILLYTPQ